MPVAMSTLNVDKLKERLRVIQGTEDGIRTLSRYFLTNYRHAAACVRVSGAREHHTDKHAHTHPQRTKHLGEQRWMHAVE